MKDIGETNIFTKLPRLQLQELVPITQYALNDVLSANTGETPNLAVLQIEKRNGGNEPTDEKTPFTTKDAWERLY
jgi:hypothetical protein